MNVIAVDDKLPIVNDMLNKLRTLEMIDSAIGFTDPFDALECVKNSQIDISFLDVEMPLISGLELARQIKIISPRTYIIFLTGFRQYTLDAYELHAIGYLLKPVSTKRIITEIENIKNIAPPPMKHRIRVQTFNGFDLFADNKVILFPRAKSKELLAVLVDKKGATATTRDLSAILWEDKPYTNNLKSYFHSVLTDMIAALKTANAHEIVIKGRNSFAIDPEKFDCDYYRFLEDNSAAINDYTGGYMSQYSWAEFTAGVLDSKLFKI